MAFTDLSLPTSIVAMLLGSKTLIHFRTNGISEYLSSLVDYSFKGYAKKIIKYDIDFTKVKIVKVAGGKKNEKK